MNPAHEHNRRAWDARARQRARHTKTVQPEHLQNPLPILDPENWLRGNVRGLKALCLAAGGGLQGPMLAAAGALVTVVDLSGEMLELDRKIAREHRLELDLRQLSMDDLSTLPPATYDLVLQPVSSCYIPDIRKMFREVARVLKPGALYISQHKQPANLQADAIYNGSGYLVRERCDREGPLPPLAMDALHREADTIEYLHRWESILGGLCRAGFVIEDAVEPQQHDATAPVGTFAHRSLYLPPYIKMKARRTNSPTSSEPASPRLIL